MIFKNIIEVGADHSERPYPKNMWPCEEECQHAYEYADC